MDTLTIKIHDQKAVKLIHDLELLNLIQIVRPVPKAKKRLSDVMQGSISKEEATAYLEKIDTLKNEWERTTY